MGTPDREGRAEGTSVQSAGAIFERCVTELVRLAPDDVVGVYGPESMHWTVFREPILAIGGLRAIALQVAHPMVAAGVATNSNYRNDVIGRARRTFVAMYELVFGTRTEALDASMRVHALHRRVAAVTPKVGTGRWGGEPVRALDPRLLNWVLSTCLETSVQVFETFVRPMSLAEKQAYYQESMRMGLQFGLLPEHRPPDWERFQIWYQGMLGGDELIASELAQEVIHDLFNNVVTRGPLDELITSALLPERWRDAYKLRFGPNDQRAWRALVLGLRAARAAVPAPYRYVVAWHQAVHRVEVARGGRGTRYHRLLNRLDTHVNLPFSIRPVAPHAARADGSPDPEVL